MIRTIPQDREILWHILIGINKVGEVEAFSPKLEKKGNELALKNLHTLSI